MRLPTWIMCAAGAATALLLAGTPAGAYETAASAIAALSAQGIMAGGPQYPGRLVMSPVDLVYVLERFETRTGHHGIVTAASRFATRVTRSRGVVDILLATGLSRTNNSTRARRIATHLGLFDAVAGMGAAHAPLTRGQVAIMLINLEHHWNLRTRPLSTIGVLNAQGIMATASQSQGRMPMSAVDLASILVRFEAHTGHHGTILTTVQRTGTLSRNQGLVAILQATGLSRTHDIVRNRRIASRIGLFAGISGMDAGNAPLTRDQAARMLVNLERHWHMGL